MDNNIQPQQPQNRSRVIVGVALLGFGCILLLKQLDVFLIPDDVELWPLWLIFAGLLIGARGRFHKPSSFILIALGCIFLVTNNISGSEHVIWPLGIIAFGLWIIARKRAPYDKNYWEKEAHKWDWRSHVGPNAGVPPTSDSTYTNPTQPNPSARPMGDDYLDAVSVFGGVKKMILSKDFKGGEIVNVFGGAELDFTQADINGTVIIDITQIFGGVKMVVPANWQVVSDLSAVFASVDDKRIRSVAPLNSDKILVLKGVSIFAGIDIRSF